MGWMALLMFVSVIGVLLLVVLSVLVLFMLVGTTFLVTSNQYRTAATGAAKAGRVDTPPDDLLNRALMQVLRDTNNPYSVARYHSLLRDLYGTVVNEGAIKGILVTTAAYGPDAYEFAKGKPLTLLDGGNLLHLLDRHGHKAKIDLKEAKRILSERDKEKRERT